MLDRLLGFIRPNYGARAEIAPPTPPVRVIPGGPKAPELCMLCRDTTIEALAGDQSRQPVQLKVDGHRALFVHAAIVSREGVPMPHVQHCQPALRRLEEAFGEPMFFDGEYIADGGFAATGDEQKAKRGAGVLWLFDAMPVRDWQNGFCATPLRDRLVALRERIHTVESEFVGMLDWWELTGPETAVKAMELWAHGYEGVVRKHGDSAYDRRRSDCWQRLKLTHTATLPIVDAVVKDGKLRAVFARAPNGTAPFKLGKGWSADEAARIVEWFTGERILQGEAIQDSVRHRFDASGHVRPKPGYGNDALTASVSYQMTTGLRPTVRGATFHHLI